MKNTTFGRLRKMSRSVKALLFLSLFSLSAQAQVFWTENWTSGGTGWNLAVPTGTEGADPNFFLVADDEGGGITPDLGAPTSCGAANNSNNTMFITSVFNPTGGAAYDAGGLCGFLFCPLTNRRAESPTINCTGKMSISVNFNYIEGGQAALDDATLWYFNGTVWAQIDNMPKTLTGCGGQGLWKSRSIALPASADNNASVKIAFRWVNNDDGTGTDPSFAVDDITLSTASLNTIVTGTVTGPFCACSFISVPFTSTGTFFAGNVYTAELSDAAGSFASPVGIGTLVSTVNSGTILSFIPCPTPAGTGYRIRVTSSAPPVTGTDNGINITINALPVATFSYTGTPYCQSGTDPSPTFSGGGVAGTFSSTAGLVFVSTSTGQVDLSASTPGTYTVTNTISASGGCGVVSATSGITINAAPVATFTYTPVSYCRNGVDPSPTYSGGGVAGTFSSTAGLVFVSTSTGQVDLSASTPGTYTVINTIAASGGCPTVTGSASIIINTVQDSTFAYSGSTFCQSGANPTPTITTPGGTFTSTPAGLVFVSATTGQINLASSALGTYAVTYTTPGPCASSSTVAVTITTAPASTFSYTGTPYCQSAIDPSPTYSGGGSAGTFTSTTGLVFVSAATGQVDLSASTAGTYTVTNTIAASGGCPASSSTSNIVINALQDSTFAYSGSTFCQSGTNPIPTITGVAGGTFTSSPAGLVFVSASTGEIDLAGSTLGTYSIAYTTPGPCAGTMTVSVTITNAPAATFNYTAAAYCQNDADPSPIYSGGGSAGTFTASPAGLVFVSTTTGQVDLSASTAGTYLVTNTIAASGGCPASSDTAAITVNAAQDSTFAYSASTFCQAGSNPTPTITGTAGGTFTSTAGLVFVSTSTGEIDLASSTLGTYPVTYTTPGPCAGSMTVSVTITTSPVADFNYSAAAYCQNDPDPSPVYSSGGSAGTFTASPAGLVFVSATTGQVNLAGSTPGTYLVTNTISASGCPTASDTATITINAVPAVTVTSATICTGNTANLTASGATTYTWTAGVTPSTGANVSATPATTTSYTVTGTTGSCSATAVAVVTVNNCNVPDAAFSGTPQVMCQAGCVNFTDLSTNTPTSWLWLFPGATPATSTTQNPTNICYSADGSYSVTLIATNSSGSDTLTQQGFITVGQPIPVTITGNLLITSCEETVLTAEPSDGTYTWGPSSSLSSTSGASVTATPTSTQQYYVTYTSPEGCVDSDTTVVVVDDINTWFLPTGFTPNGDDVNDEVHLHGRGIQFFTLRIFDRIGEKVFETSDLDKGWNGRLHGIPMNDGVFVYVLDITFCNGEVIKKHGDITLVK